ncbi:ABC transporter permease [Micromonospora sp. NPDC049523]|uniref:ABC transporter permease n=1 Tax=Micromonospora sp. NPDC049523 TaxID=3155921 RepID=UPI0034300DCB
MAHEWRLQRRDLLPIVTRTVMPVILIAVLLPTYRGALQQAGTLRDNATEHAVPGFAVMFGLMLVSDAGTTFFRDHSWHTWLRLRSLPVPMPLLVGGKLVVPFLLVLAQTGAVLGFGVLLFDMRIRGSVGALVVLAAVFAAFVVSLTFLSVALCQTLLQLSAVANIFSLAIAGIGGALVPVALLPQPLPALAPLTPTYWAMRGFDVVISDGGGLAAVSPMVGILLAQTAVLGVLGAALFRPSRTKVGWA